MSKINPLAVIGTVAMDAVETPFGKRDRVFGGSASYFSYAASLMTPVSLVAVVGKDFPDEYLNILKERPIDLSHLETKDGKTFSWAGKYEYDMNTAQTLDTQLNVLLEFDPTLHFDIPPSFLFLANIDPSLQTKVLDQLPKSHLKFVACDTMNYWIANKKEDLLRVLPRIDCLVINDGEARELTGEVNLMRAATKIRQMGSDRVVIKKGEHGVMAFGEGKYFTLPAYPLETVVDPTGAGDSFAGGMMGYMASCQNFTFEHFKRAVAFGCMVASFTVEDFGLEALRKCHLKDIEERLEIFRKISSL